MHQLKLEAQFKVCNRVPSLSFQIVDPRVAPIQILNNLVERHALHSKGLEHQRPKVSAVMILTSHTGGCQSHIYIQAHTQATSNSESRGCFGAIDQFLHHWGLCLYGHARSCECSVYPYYWEAIGPDIGPLWRTS